MRIGRWELSGFAYFDFNIDCWSGARLFRFDERYEEEKVFVWDAWIPFFGFRFELRKMRERWTISYMSANYTDAALLALESLPREAPDLPCAEDETL